MDIPSRELTPEDLELIEFARQIVDANADGESGIHTMGAAVRGADGQLYGGINVYHLTGGPCAELVALGHARASGGRELSAIVAVGNCGRGPVGPCGRDRQVLFDYHSKIRVRLSPNRSARPPAAVVPAAQAQPEVPTASERSSARRSRAPGRRRWRAWPGL